ncbi:MAG TPA: hypothetical protein ENK18_24500 [Deltaproteobacteria bacterium]|nr:hypothetical protein [Deltaproteobacteria bacterium]
MQPGPWDRRQRWILGIVTLLCLVVLVSGPAWPRGYARTSRALTVAPDMVVAIVILWGLQWIRGGWRASAERRGSTRAWLVGVFWALLCTYELGRACSRIATNEDLPIYDLLLLSKHLWVLGRDLYGVWATVAVLVLLLVPVGLTIVGTLLAGRLEAWARSVGPARSLASIAVIAVLSAGVAVSKRSTFVMPWLISNLSESWDLLYEVRSDIQDRPHRGLEDLTLTRRPDVHIYIVESYGDVVRRDEALAARWAPGVDALEEHLTERGWYTASGLSEAPVHGGRSWIADASLLLGLYVARQSTYEHLIGLTDQLPHLPGFFAGQGYETVLVRAKDRARPGVSLVNHFGFGHTVFFDDLEYEGPVVGWGHIPDQYTIDFVNERVLDELDAPTFAFFHLATAHIPWREAPPLLDPYTRWQGRRGRSRALVHERSAYSELRMRMSRFKYHRRESVKESHGDPQNYLDSVLYDLEAIARQLEDGPDGEQIILIMGDHQPPLIAQGMSSDVPVHVLASDPSLLRGFIDAGFEPRLRPREIDGADVEHRGLFALIVGAIATAGPAVDPDPSGEQLDPSGEQPGPLGAPAPAP